jgi:hypothetical protein
MTTLTAFPIGVPSCHSGDAMPNPLRPHAFLQLSSPATSLNTRTQKETQATPQRAGGPSSNPSTVFSPTAVL